MCVGVIAEKVVEIRTQKIIRDDIISIKYMFPCIYLFLNLKYFNILCEYSLHIKFVVEIIF